jgi:hypothetical protein
MQLAAPYQAPGDVGRLQRRAFGRGMGRKITRHRNEALPASVSVVPLAELPDSRLQHLTGMDACIFAQNGTRERVDQLLRRGARWGRRLTAEFAHLISINTDQTLNDLRSGKCGSHRFKGLLLRLSNTSKGGKNENGTSSLVLVRTHFYPVRMAGMVLWTGD